MKLVYEKIGKQRNELYIPKLNISYLLKSLSNIFATYGLYTYSKHHLLAFVFSLWISILYIGANISNDKHDTIKYFLTQMNFLILCYITESTKSGYITNTCVPFSKILVYTRWIHNILSGFSLFLPLKHITQLFSIAQ